MHESQRASFSAQCARQQRNQARQARLMVSRGARQPAPGCAAAGQPASRQMGLPAPTSRCGIGRGHIRAAEAREANSHATDHQRR
eukprot:3903883-Pyramimonas_sp.AAC.1